VREHDGGGGMREAAATAGTREGGRATMWGRWCKRGGGVETEAWDTGASERRGESK
jgi:hypothetical protein